MLFSKFFKTNKTKLNTKTTEPKTNDTENFVPYNPYNEDGSKKNPIYQKGTLLKNYYRYYVAKGKFNFEFTKNVDITPITQMLKDYGFQENENTFKKDNMVFYFRLTDFNPDNEVNHLHRKGEYSYSKSLIFHTNFQIFYYPEDVELIKNDLKIILDQINTKMTLYYVTSNSCIQIKKIETNLFVKKHSNYTMFESYKEAYEAALKIRNEEFKKYFKDIKMVKDTKISPESLIFVDSSPFFSNF